jgi:hypothetical protein
MTQRNMHKTTFLYDFEFSIQGFDFSADVEVYDTERDETDITVYDIKIEYPELFNKDYIMAYIESNLQDELYEAYHKNDQTEPDGDNWRKE